MTTDNTVVVQLADATKSQQTALPAQESTTQAPPAKPPEPLTAEKVQQMIAEATAKAVQDAKDIGRRELQSQQDKNRAENAKILQRARLAESTLRATRDSLTKLDPDAAKDVELAALRAREQGMTEAERDEAAAKAQEEFHQSFVGTLTSFVKSLGVDPKDPRIDWAADASNYLVAQQRVLDSVSKIQTDKVQSIQSDFDKRLKALETKGKTENTESPDKLKEANSVNTNTSGGGVITQSDKEFMAKLGDGTLPMTAENTARYNKILKSSQ